MTDQQYKDQLAKIELQNRQILLRRQLWAKRLEVFPKIKLPSMSKLIVILMVISYFGIIIYTCYEMHVQCDLSSLYALIGISASMSAVIWGYFSKAKAENTRGGLTFESAMASSLETIDGEIVVEDDPEAVG